MQSQIQLRARTIWYPLVLLGLVLLCDLPATFAQNVANPQEKDVLTTTSTNGAVVTATTVSASTTSITTNTDASSQCSPQILTRADISGNQYISRAEYVNLLLDLAPRSCPIIQAWLDEEALAQVFNELSCLCHTFGGIDGEQNCCLQAVGLPMLASFATPFNDETNYPDKYTDQVCEKIDRVIAEQCGTIHTDAPTTNVPTSQAPTVAPTTEVPSSTSTTPEPSVAATEEGTSAGGTEEIVIEGGQVLLDIYIQDDDAFTNTNVFDDEPKQPEGDDLAEEIQETENVIQQQDDPEKEASVTSPSPTYSAGTASQDDLPPPTPTENEDSGLVTTEAPPSDIAAATAVVDTSSETPVGVVFVSLFVIAFIFTLAGWIVWTKRRQLFENQPWNKSGSGLTGSHSNLSYTKDENEDDDDSDEIHSGSLEEDLPTPVRSNLSGSSSRRRPSSSNHSFSSDDGDSSGTDTDDDATAPSDLERPGDTTVHTAPTNPSGRNKGVVRVEFQDDLSVWGRRKRRKSERQQRREERRRASLEHVAPERKNNLNTILSNLESDLCGPASSTTEHGSGVGMEMQGQPSSFHSLASESTKGVTPPGTPLGGSNTKSQSDHLALDIFDDASESSSYDGSPKNDQNELPLETSIEDWLANNAISVGGAAVASDDRSVSSKLSVASSKASTGSFVKQPQHPQLQRQPQDPLLSEWNAQRHNQQVETPKKIGFGRFQVACSSPSPRRSCTSVPKDSVPASPVMVLQETVSLRPVTDNGETKHADTPPYDQSTISIAFDEGNDSSVARRPHKLDLPTNQNLCSDDSSRPAPKLSPESLEFYESVLRMEPPEEDESSQGNAFAFEAARSRETSPPERYLV